MRPCFLALRRALAAPVRASGVVVVAEEGRALGSADVADALGLPVRLEVLRGSPAGRFYERHGFVKLGEDDVEAEYERVIPSRASA